MSVPSTTDRQLCEFGVFLEDEGIQIVSESVEADTVDKIKQFVIDVIYNTLFNHRAISKTYAQKGL